MLQSHTALEDLRSGGLFVSDPSLDPVTQAM